MIDPGLALLAGIAALVEPGVSLGDLGAFPPRRVVQHWLAINADARCALAAREVTDRPRAGWWWEARCEAAQTEATLTLLANAGDAGNPDPYRLEQLRRLRRVIGWRNYYGGRLPCPVPLWAFPEVREANPLGYIPVRLSTTQ